MTGRPAALPGLGLVAALTTGACTTGADPASSGAAPGAASGSTLISQPTPPTDFPLAPESQRIEVLVSQYVVFAGGRIKESAIDWLAEPGSVSRHR